MPDQCVHTGVSQGFDKRQHIIHQLQHMAGSPIPIQSVIASVGAAIAALIGCNHMESCSRQIVHLMTPTESKLWEAV